MCGGRNKHAAASATCSFISTTERKLHRACNQGDIGVQDTNTTHVGGENFYGRENRNCDLILDRTKAKYIVRKSKTRVYNLVPTCADANTRDEDRKDLCRRDEKRVCLYDPLFHQKEVAKSICESRP